MKAKIPSTEDLKEYLELAHENLTPLISKAETVDEILKIVIKECSVTNICYLDGIVEQFKASNVEEDISKYKQFVEEKCTCLPIEFIEQHHLRSLSSSRLIRDKIEFIVCWEPKEKQLKDIEGILWKAFGEMVEVVHVDTAKKVNSIAIICYAPHSMMTFLMMRAKRNLDILQDMGVMSLFVGYYTLLDHKSQEQVSQVCHTPYVHVHMNIYIESYTAAERNSYSERRNWHFN